MGLVGPKIDQARDLLQGLGYNWKFAEAQPFWPHSESDGTAFGNAIASRFPIESSRALRARVPAEIASGPCFWYNSGPQKAVGIAAPGVRDDLCGKLWEISEALVERYR